MNTVNLTLGQEQLRAGNVSAAENLALQALAQDPKNHDALELHYDCAMARDNYQEGKTRAQKWLEICPYSVRAHEGMIMVHFRLREKVEARKALQILKDSFPLETLSIRIYEALYDVHFGSGRAASKAFVELSKEYPEIHGFVKIQGDTAFNNDQMFKANRFYREAIKLDPTHADTWRMYAINSFHIMHYGTARKAAKRAIELDPTLEDLRFMVYLSWAVYFPMFYIASFMGTSYFYLSEYLGKLVGGIAAFVAGYAIFGKLFVMGSIWLQKQGLDLSFMQLFGGVILWLVLEQGLFIWMGRKKKPKDVKLSGY